MMEQQSFHPLDYLAVAGRRKWWFILPLTVCIALGAITLSVWPKKYLSRASIAVQSPTLVPDLLKGVSSMDPVERQRAVQQLLLSPTVLDRVIREEKIGSGKPPTEVALWLRDNLSRNIEVPPTLGLNGRPDPTRGIELFYIGYTDSDPARAQRIANRVAAVFVDENSKVQQSRAENSAEVLGQLVEASKAKLTDLENRLRAKKQSYMGRLPDQVGANVQILNGSRQQFESLSIQIRSEQDHLALVESQIDSLRRSVNPDTVPPANPEAAQRAQQARKRVDDLEAQLAADRALGYTDRHPDVDRISRELKQARADLTAAQASAKPASREELLNSDPGYKQKLQERDVARMHLKELQNAAASAQAQIGAFQNRVEAAPVVEQELTSVQREYEMEKARYADLNTRYQNALGAEDLTKKQGGEKFSILFPATLPTTPIEPQPLKIWALAIAAGLALGGAAALGREFLDRSVHDSRALQNEFEVPVLGEIPRITV